MEEIATAVTAAGQISQANMLWIMGALVTVITTLGGVVTAQYNKKSNPLNGTLVKLESTLGQVNTSLGKLDVRTEASNRVAETSSRVLERHTEKLMTLSINEAAQTKALLELKPALDASLTGCAVRITDHCVARSGDILAALDKQ